MAVFLFAFILVGIFPILFRAKGANVFMMLCVGRALMDLAADEVGVAARMILNSALPIDDIAQIFLMLLPATLALMLTRKAAKKKFPYHIIPSICAGLLAGFWSVSLMSNLGDFKTSTTYNYVQANTLIILGIGIVSTLLLFIAERPKPVKPEDQEGHHKK